MAGVPDWLAQNGTAVLAAAAAIVSAVSSQIVAGIFSLRASRRKEESDLRAADAERRDSVGRMLRDERRTVFSEILTSSSELAFTLTRNIDLQEREKIYREFEELAQRIELISLLAPDSYPACKAVFEYLAGQWEDCLEGGDPSVRARGYLSFQAGELESMRTMMRKELSLGYDAPETADGKAVPKSS